MANLLGVAQMNLGIYFNAKNFSHEQSFFLKQCHEQFYVWYQFIQQLTFLNSLFGYLFLLIIIKWCMGQKQNYTVYSLTLNLFRCMIVVMDKITHMRIWKQPNQNLFRTLLSLAVCTHYIARDVIVTKYCIKWITPLFRLS